MSFLAWFHLVWAILDVGSVRIGLDLYGVSQFLNLDRLVIVFWIGIFLIFSRLVVWICAIWLMIDGFGSLNHLLYLMILGFDFVGHHFFFLADFQFFPLSEGSCLCLRCYLLLKELGLFDFVYGLQGQIRYI